MEGQGCGVENKGRDGQLGEEGAGEHYEYNPEGVYYGDDKTTYYTDYVRSQSAGSESSEEEVAGQDRDYVVDSNGYVVPA